MFRRWMMVPGVALVVALVEFALMLVGASTAAASSCSQSGSMNTCTFSFTGVDQTWTVPDGVRRATFDVQGAQGGESNFNEAGLGGEAIADLSLTPGATVTLVVGGRGASPAPGGFCGVTPGAGGFNGGAGGGNGSCPGPGGGGASDVRIGGSDLSDRVLVAGGGGADSNASGANCGATAFGGGGGGLTGGNGFGGAPGCSTGGSGGNQTGTTGSGQLGAGSAGQDGNPSGGGGGGGGYYGGAGGGPDGGGGGGSGFGPAATTFHTGVHSGDGTITIAWTVLPTTKNQCMNGGWQTFGVFKNQGDCVSFVATGGKNPPSGS